MSHLWRKHLSEPWFDLVCRGEKSVEGRLDRGDFGLMQPGDSVIWYNGDYSCATKIVSIRRYRSFIDFLKGERLSDVLPGIKTKEQGLEIYRRFYGCEDTIHGVVALEVEVLRP
ncbi:MAG: ASCH domain-containing protein [Sulfobacillus sp.]